MKHAQPPLPVDDQVCREAEAVCRDALALSRLQKRSSWAALAWAIPAQESPLALYDSHSHTRRRLLWRDDEWQLALGISATTRHDGASRFFGIAEDASAWRNRMCFRRCDPAAPDLAFFIEASFESSAPLNSHWGTSLAGCRMIMPQRLFWQRGEQCWVYSSCAVHPDDNLEQLTQQLIGSLPKRPFLQQQPWPELQLPDFQQIVEEAVALLQSASMRKIVLARAVDEELQQEKPASAIIESLHQAADKQSTSYAYDLDDGAIFIGATPELLFTLDQQHCAAMALAGTRPRGADALEDQALATELLNSTKERKEHQLVVEHLAKILQEREAQIDIPAHPDIRRLQKMQHLETDLSCDLQHANAFDLLSAIYPTPAVCGLPVAAARQFIRRHEQMHRGLYTGAIGYHMPEHTHFVVPLRGGIVRGRQARLFAGAGLVETSDPQAEEEETETKLRLMRQALHQ